MAVVDVFKCFAISAIPAGASRPSEQGGSHSLPSRVRIEIFSSYMTWDDPLVSMGAHMTTLA